MALSRIHPSWMTSKSGRANNSNNWKHTCVHSTHTLSTIRVNTSFETYSSIMRIPNDSLKISFVKSFYSHLFSLTVIAIKDHNTISSFKTQLQRETLASESLTSTNVITLQLTCIMQHIIHKQKRICFATLAKNK